MELMRCRFIAALLLAAPLLVACADHGSTPAGTVVDRSRRSVSVREDAGGRVVEHTTSKNVSRRCSVGERWPDCV
ncbi:hypothetical protein ETD86_21530 [Nonomuraea turkmeniaca]|uniref:Uncharacterized protein n=1 Tax=Nonomuraea turkmeniaca TaxID=103838 RepID=A0A5S4FHK9_9ACTN|nr:hypothetical protein [Nonomuraea turkmeniaca]TMR18534.1 hypothetical protein ETD86_21530 [Nonomuraea turkmeniaca]